MKKHFYKYIKTITLLSLISATISCSKVSSKDKFIIIENDYKEDVENVFLNSDTLDLNVGYKYKILSENKESFDYIVDDNYFEIYEGYLICKKEVKNMQIEISKENKSYHINIDSHIPSDKNSISFIINSINYSYLNENNKLSLLADGNYLSNVNRKSIDLDKYVLGDVLTIDYVGEYILNTSEPGYFNLYNGYAIKINIDDANIIQCIVGENNSIILEDNSIINNINWYWSDDLAVIYNKNNHYRMLSSYEIGDKLYASKSTKDNQIYGLYEYNPKNRQNDMNN